MEALYLDCGARRSQLMRYPLGSTAGGMVPEPLLFVGTSKRVRRGSQLARASLATLETPAGTVFTAFGSHELASAILALFGAAEGVFLLPETRIVPELVPAKPTSPVLVFMTHEDYNAAMSHAPDFPWVEHIIEYDFAAAAANASVARDAFDGRKSRPAQ